MPQPSDFAITELREKAREYGISAGGSKAEIISRLMEYDPTGEWTEGRNNEDDATGEGANGEREAEFARREREFDFMKRERELIRRELELARREIEILRIKGAPTGDESQERGVRERRNEAKTEPDVSPCMNLKMIAELVSEFDGTPENFDVWERQVKFMRTTYMLTDDVAKTLIGMKLRKKAFEWLHSKAEHLSLTFDELMDEIGRMYRPKRNRIELRKRFEARVWKKGESFREYAHDKIIIGNRVPIDDCDMLDYLIDGIPDRTLRNQARIQNFATKESLIEAFDKITLREQTFTGSGQWEKRNDIATKTMRGGVNTRNEESDMTGGKTRAPNRKICYNCGQPGHVSALCPAKERGPKCFRCSEHGHIASKCPNRRNEVTDEVRAVTLTLHKKYIKTVNILGREVEALVDTGSDLTLMCKSEYAQIGSPLLRPTEARFKGVGSPAHTALGEFQTEITVDGHRFPVLVRVVANGLSRQRLLIGADFLELRSFRGEKGAIYFDRDENDENMPEILQINVLDEDVPKADLSHIKNVDAKRKIATWINEYEPDKAVETSVTMKLVLSDDDPVYQKARRLAVNERNIVNTQIEEWISRGIARPSSSDYASPIVLVKKKDDSYRLCVDYRLLNKKIIRDRYPLPLIEDQLDRLQAARVFSTLDLKNGFFHVPVDSSSIRYTAFIVPDGQFEFLRMPFGLCNSPSVFQRYVNAIFRDALRDGNVLAYMDDLIILSESCEDGLIRLKYVLEIASKAGLEINWGKCRFLTRRVEFLGHIIENGTVKPSERKTEAVRRFAEPVDTRQVQAFLGLTGYFRKFIADYSRIARPLSNLLRSGVKFSFDRAEREAFNSLKTSLSQQPILNLYRIGAETELHTDASKYGYGAILLQRNGEDGQLHPIYFASGKTTPAEEKYSSYELEVLAIIRALRRFRVYLLGIRFKIITDCKAFTMTMNKKDLCVRVARWVLFLEDFEYIIEHRAGRSMRHVDALSRNPLSTCLTVDESDESLAARFRKAQRDDADLKEKLERTENGELSGYSTRGGLLYKDVGDETLLVVPRSMQLQVIRRAHERGHFATNKTETLVRSEYWIPDLRSKTEKVIRNCISCILAERQRGKREGFLNPIEKGSVPFDTFHVDHLGPLPTTKKSYAHILVVVDAFTKFIWLYATKSTTSAEVIDRLRKQSYVFANPRRLISDRGTAFTSKEFENYCREEGIEHVLITTGIPRANGQVERVNRTLIPLLTKLSAPKSGEWYKYVSDAQRRLNVTPHRSTGTTPFRLMFGVDARLADDPKIKELLHDELITSFDEEREELRRYAKENIQRTQSRNKRKFDETRREAHRYRAGDLVAIRRTQQVPGAKFMHKYLGPYEITKVLRNDRYIVRRIDETEGPKQTSTAADSMKPWTSDDGEDQLRSDDEDQHLEEEAGINEEGFTRENRL